ncbi:major paralogous domain-containing protein [Fibrobacter sp. UWT2]|nr:major paralogous domain-containing protein [Fibrobacter sp. UWT2]
MMKKFVLGGMVVVAALLGNACGDDGSSDSPAGPADSEVTLSSSSDDVALGSSSSSSVTESPSTSSGQAPQSAESDGSSSSEKAVDGSSSSDGKASSSSGKVESSSSGKGEKSSSSEGTAGSSSSDVVAGSSSSEKSSSSVTESSSSIESSSSEVPSSSSIEESSSSVLESSSSLETESSSSITLSSSSETPAVMSIYDAENNTLTDLRDNQVYRTVTIGSQIWMAENLNLKYNKGSAKSYCYNDSIKYCNNYGRLYTKSAAMDSAAVYSNTSKNCGDENINNCTLKKNARGICPENWHIPDSTEWRTLLSYVEGKINLMSSPPWDESCDVGNDVYNFSVLPGGNKSMYGTYANMGNMGAEGFWFSTIHARIVNFGCYASDVLFQSVGRGYAYPVRCVKDN